jgi:hypothetical protein
VGLSKDDSFDGPQLDYIGRLFAFAVATDTRLLAQVSGPGVTSYELWFSFNADGQKQKFLQMVRDDGYADPDDEDCLFVPDTLEDLPELRPIERVFPKAQCDRIIAVATVTSVMMESNPGLIN